MDQIQDNTVHQGQYSKNELNRSQRRIWSPALVFVLLLGSILGNCLVILPLFGVGMPPVSAVFFVLLGVCLAYLYGWIWCLEKERPAGAKNWPAAISGGCFLGVMAAFLQLLMEHISSARSPYYSALGNMDYSIVRSMMALEHFSIETVMAFLMASIYGILLVLFLPRKVSAIFFGGILIVGYLWGRSVSGRISDGLLISRQLGMLSIYASVGMPLLLYGGLTAISGRWRISIFPERQDPSQPCAPSTYTKQKQTRIGALEDVCGPVIWGWLVALILTYNRGVMIVSPFLLPGILLCIVPAILVQTITIRLLFVYNKKSMGYRLIALVAGIPLGVTFALMLSFIFRGLNPRAFYPPYAPMEYTILIYLTVPVFLAGLFFGYLSLMLFRKDKALLICGILMFTPAAIAMLPPVMRLYHAPGSFVGLAYWYTQTILYFPMGISMGCIMVAARNILRTRRIKRSSEGNSWTKRLSPWG